MPRRLATAFALSSTLALLAPLTSGCGKQEPQPRPQAAQPQNPLEQAANDAARAIREQSHEWNRGLDEFANQLDDAVRKSQQDLRGRIESKAQEAQQAATKHVKRQTDELAEFAAQMAEDAKDRALDIPDVLDEFFGPSGSSRGDWRNRSGQSPRGPRRN